MQRPIYLQQREVFLSLIDRLRDPVKRRLFDSMPHRMANAATPGFSFRIFRWDGEYEQDTIMFEIVSFWVREDGIPACEIKRKDTGEHLTVDTTPTQLWDREIFMFMPQHFEYSVSGVQRSSGIEYRPRFTVLFQARSRKMDRTPGHDFVQPANAPLGLRVPPKSAGKLMR